MQRSSLRGTRPARLEAGYRGQVFTVFPPPPDGARLADRPTRQDWCSRLEIAYALPAEGWLWIPARSGFSPLVAVTAETWTAVSASNPADRRATAVQPDTAAALRDLWPELWLAPPAVGDIAALMHFRGLLRTLDRDQAAPLAALLSPHVSGSAS